LFAGIPFFSKMCSSTDSDMAAGGSYCCGTVSQRCAEPSQWCTAHFCSSGYWRDRETYV